MKAKKAKSYDGRIHAVNESNAEFTLCGDAFDADCIEESAGWKEVKRGSINCAECCSVIESLRGARMSPEAKRIRRNET